MRRIGLQLRQLARVFGGQGIGDGRENLSNFHERAFQPTQNHTQIFGVFIFVALQAEKPFARHARSKPTNACSNLRVSFHAPAHGVFVAARHCVKRPFRADR